ncbi:MULTISPECIES: TatD family hydrolase [unclassified Paenibacillus]|uniref:TatD family hydrolase n=1 Tax=unclassified Paenibacillus TaxID=185978 RepID=UPI001AE86265|nr:MULTISPECIES: TatD family hydrolase [unclassified Paenibacillus]MBP1154176.1 TatD DNase family protein [Paenibacillus sp. PvP091]MBP1170439.1 TatD DNase family protein [Paenibacillus sp. PvR098]MBP2441467.1 TatD DNase family protein [Paenibacillus sp. PvP052]
MYPIIDAHVHLDLYEEMVRERLLESRDLYRIQGFITVSMNAGSCLRNLRLKQQLPHAIFPAFGYHPEQAMPAPEEEEALFVWIHRHRDEMVAIGEIGLPYYMRKAAEERGELFNDAPYFRLLERFVQLAAQLNKPVVLHAVYEDAERVCDLLEKFGVEKAHFHWFKGSTKTLDRMKKNGYAVSVTPDVVYKAKIQAVVEAYPLELLMVETDGPWPFEGAFEGQTTHPCMSRESIRQISILKGLPEQEVGMVLFENTRRFYNLPL